MPQLVLNFTSWKPAMSLLYHLFLTLPFWFLYLSTCPGSSLSRLTSGCLSACLTQAFPSHSGSSHRNRTYHSPHLPVSSFMCSIKDMPSLLEVASVGNVFISMENISGFCFCFWEWSGGYVEKNASLSFLRMLVEWENAIMLCWHSYIDPCTLINIYIHIYTCSYTYILHILNVYV